MFHTKRLLLAVFFVILITMVFFVLQGPYYPTGLYILGPDFFEDDYSNANGIATQNNVVVENGYVRPTGAGGSEIDPNGPLGTGLIALWHFNGNANDSKGSLNGTPTGSTVCNVSGKFGQACSLDDTGGNVDFGQNNFGEGLSAMTFSVWFKNTQTGGFPSGNAFIVLKYTNVIDIHWDTDTKLYFGAYNSGGQYAFASSNTGFNDTTNWHHLAGVYNGSNVLLYLDGVLQTSQPSLTGTIATSGNGFGIGLGWKGLLDEIGVWNRALSSQEVQSLYTAGGGISGSFESININPSGNPSLYSLSVDWNETGAGTSLEVTTNNGQAWCAMTDGGSLNNQNCPLPADAFKYRVNFISNTNLLGIKFNWATTPQPVCGNNTREGNEVCDGTDLNGQTCQTRGYQSGTLRCLQNCTGFDTSSCISNAVCRNNVIEPPEVCECGVDNICGNQDDNLNGQTCQTQGYQSGTLTCANTCLTYNTSQCTGQQQSGTIYVDGQLQADCTSNNYSIANRNCTGTDGKAYNTIQEAANVVTAGDTLEVRGGTYTEQVNIQASGTENSRITVKRYMDEIVVIDSENTRCWGVVVGKNDPGTTFGNYVTVDGFTIKNPWADPVCSVSGGILVIGADNVIVSNNHIFRDDYPGYPERFVPNDRLATGIRVLGHSKDVVAELNTIHHVWGGIVARTGEGSDVGGVT